MINHINIYIEQWISFLENHVPLIQKKVWVGIMNETNIQAPKLYQIELKLQGCS